MEEKKVSNEMKYLSNKKTHLSAPGYIMNDLYYTAYNSKVNSVENTVMTGRYSQTLTSSNFGSSATIQIPNSSFVGQLYLHLELPNLVANQSITQGWGLAVIESVSYLIGSSNTPQIELSGDSIRDTLLLQCESAEKAQEMILSAGEQYTDPLDNSGNNPYRRIEATVLIPTPFSSFATLHSKKYFDSNLINNPITINIKFKGSDSIYGGPGARPTSFSKALVFTKQAVLTNKELSLKGKLMRNPSLVSNYPFLYRQSYTTRSFTGKKPDSGQKISLPLLSFINADLLGIVLSIKPVNLQKSNADGSVVAATLVTDLMYDVNIDFNGQSIYNVQGTSGVRMSNMCGMVGASFYPLSYVTDRQVGTTTQGNKKCYLTYADFSLKRPDIFNDEFQNTFRIPNNSLNVSFYTEYEKEYVLTATYIYNGIISVTSDGTTRMFLN